MDQRRASRNVFEVFRSMYEHDQLYKRWSLEPWGDHRYWFEMDDADLSSALDLLDQISVLVHTEADRFQLTVEGAQACIRPGLFEKLMRRQTSPTSSSGVMPALEAEDPEEAAKRSA